MKYPLFGAQSVWYFRVPCFVYNLIYKKQTKKGEKCERGWNQVLSTQVFVHVRGCTIPRGNRGGRA